MLYIDGASVKAKFEPKVVPKELALLPEFDIALKLGDGKSLVLREYRGAGLPADTGSPLSEAYPEQPNALLPKADMLQGTPQGTPQQGPQGAIENGARTKA